MIISGIGARRDDRRELGTYTVPPLFFTTSRKLESRSEERGTNAEQAGAELRHHVPELGGGEIF